MAAAADPGSTQIIKRNAFDRPMVEISTPLIPMVKKVRKASRFKAQPSVQGNKKQGTYDAGTCVQGKKEAEGAGRNPEFLH